MNTWDLLEIVKAVNGKLLNAPEEKTKVTGLHHDSRKITKGSLFIPIVAERDGHDFLNDAIKKGAVTAFWSKSEDEAPTNFPVILVSDTEEALKQFAAWYLKQVTPKVVGITGSNGKTTTKDMTAAVLKTKYKTHKTAGNLNNQLGVPLTILNMPRDTELLVVEMGMDRPGEISVLSELAQPDVAAITMIGESHIEAFGTREKIAEEKLSILAGLREDGLFIYPNDEKLLVKNERQNLRKKTFGLDKTADLFATDIIEKTRETIFSVAQKNHTDHLKVTIPVPGSYNVQNALIALLVGLEFDIPVQQGVDGLEQLTITENRLEWLEGKNSTHLLNDAYNASPSSVKAVLHYFSNISTAHQQGKIIVLGDILELGNLSSTLHEDLEEAIDLNAYKAVFLYGSQMAFLYKKLKQNEKSEHVFHFEGEKAPLVSAIEKEMSAEDMILFKASNGMDLLSVVDSLQKETE